MNHFIVFVIALSTSILANCPAKMMCYEGGDLNKVPLTDNFPDCWLEAGGYWGCFKIAPGYCNKTNEKQGILLNKIQKCYKSGKTKKPDVSEVKPAPVFLAPANCLNDLKCYHGSQVNVPETDHEKFPRCWYNHGTIWGCYNPLNDSCLDINGRNMTELSVLKCNNDQNHGQNPTYDVEKYQNLEHIPNYNVEKYQNLIQVPVYNAKEYQYSKQPPAYNDKKYQDFKQPPTYNAKKY